MASILQRILGKRKDYQTQPEHDILPTPIINEVKPVGYITTKEAAQIANLTDGRIRQLLRDGLIKGKPFGHVWLVSSASLQRYVALGIKPGPRPKRKLRKG